MSVRFPRSGWWLTQVSLVPFLIVAGTASGATAHVHVVRHGPVP